MIEGTCATPLRHDVGVTTKPNPSSTATTRSITRHDQVEQPSLALDGYQPPLQLRLSERTRKLGMKHIALIRQQLAEQAARINDDSHAA